MQANTSQRKVLNRAFNFAPTGFSFPYYLPTHWLFGHRSCKSILLLDFLFSLFTFIYFFFWEAIKNSQWETGGKRSSGTKKRLSMRLHLLDGRWAARWGRSSTRISRPNWLSSSKRSCASFLSVAAGRAEDLQLPASTMTSWACFFISLYRSIENVREHVEKRIWANSRAATKGSQRRPVFIY